MQLGTVKKITELNRHWLEKKYFYCGHKWLVTNILGSIYNPYISKYILTLSSVELVPKK